MRLAPRRLTCPELPSAEVAHVKFSVTVSTERSVLPCCPLFVFHSVFGQTVVAVAASDPTAIHARPVEHFHRAVRHDFQRDFFICRSWCRRRRWGTRWSQSWILRLFWLLRWVSKHSIRMIRSSFSMRIWIVGSLSLRRRRQGSVIHCSLLLSSSGCPSIVSNLPSWRIHPGRCVRLVRCKYRRVKSCWNIGR